MKSFSYVFNLLFLWLEKGNVGYFLIKETKVKSDYSWWKVHFVNIFLPGTLNAYLPVVVKEPVCFIHYV